jgi:hypothetical protein
VLETGLDAISVRVAIVAVAPVGDGVRTRRVVLAPKGIFGRPADVRRASVDVIEILFASRCVGEVPLFKLRQVSSSPQP